MRIILVLGMAIAGRRSCSVVKWADAAAAQDPRTARKHRLGEQRPIDSADSGLLLNDGRS